MAMHIKRYEADSMEEALAQVKRELGSEALILSSRTIRQGRKAFGLLARERVEVQAALERKASASVEASEESPLREKTFEISSPGSELQNDRGESAGRGELESLIRELRREVEALREARARDEDLGDEIRSLRSAVSELTRGRGEPSSMQSTADPVVESLYRRGLDWHHAKRFVEEWRQDSPASDLAGLDRLIGRRLAAKITPPREQAMGSLRVMVGAPGVGKTTSLAKLAARNEEGERDLALVSLDQFRVGGAEQLRRYAGILESPFHEVSGIAELDGVIRGYRDRCILVDTAGRDRAAEGLMASLAPLRERLGARVSIDLVLDATARLDVQRAQRARFKSLAPDRILVTKADECSDLSAIANLVLDEESPPICWLGTGQRVPEDLQEADVHSLWRSLDSAAA